MIERHAANAPGNWYVDTRCIDCSAAQTVAPGLIVEREGQSVFARLPETPEELRMAWRARLLCPTASIRTEGHLDAPEGIFPEKMTTDVYRLGFNAKSSYGAGRCLFTGDSLAWSFEHNDLTAFRKYCWSWRTQAESLQRLAGYEFEWILAGHGGSHRLPPAEMKDRLRALVERMKLLA